MSTPKSELREWLEDAVLDIFVEQIRAGGRDDLRRVLGLCRDDAFMQAAREAEHSCPTRVSTGNPCPGCAQAAARIRAMKSRP